MVGQLIICIVGPITVVGMNCTGSGCIVRERQGFLSEKLSGKWAEEAAGK